MSKFVCVCGHVISDVQYPSTAGSIMLSETSLAGVLSYAGEVLTSLRDVEQSGSRRDWINRHFNPGYPQDATDGEILEDSISQKINDLALGVLKCGSCGRLHVQQRNGVKEYSSYVPDVPR
jgi:hypothetical protein